MTLYRCLTWSIGLLCSGGLAWAQAIDPGPARATIGQPLDLRLLVRPAPELGAARFDRRCIHAEVQIGERWLPNGALQVEVGTPDDEGLSALRLSHPTLVDEPVVQLRLHMLCGAPYSRDLSVLAQAPRESPVDPGLRKAGRQPAPARHVAPAPVQAARPVPAAVNVVAAAELHPAPLAESRSGHHQAVDPAPGDLQALARSVMKLVQAAGLEGRAGSAGAAPEARFDPVIARDIADNKYLLQELHRLRGEQQQASTAIASLHARLARAEDERWAQAVWMACAALAALFAFGVMLHIGDMLLPVLARRLKREREDPASTPRHRGPTGRSAAEPLTHAVIDPPQDLALRPVASAPRPTISMGADTIEFEPPPQAHIRPVDAGSPAQASSRSMSPPWPGDGGASHGLTSPRSGPWAHASFGPASLDHRLVSPVRDGINSAIDQGYLGFAATMLEKTLYGGVGKHPWLLMRLLDVYEQLGQPDNHERVCAEIETLYNVTVPPCRSGGSPEDDDAILLRLQALGAWPRIVLAWSGAEGGELIASLLLRSAQGGDPDQNLDLALFAELLFLHELVWIRDP